MKIGYRLMRNNNPNFSVRMANTKLKFKRSSLRIKYNKKEKLFSIKDGNKTHFFGNLVRGYGLYGKGLAKRASMLFNSYLLNNISFNSNDYVVDCGANYGDLWRVSLFI